MDNHLNRLVTFKNWPDEVIIPVIPLCDAGFYYSNQGDEVECFNCRVKLRGWQQTDVPLTRHLQYSPQCSFANQLLEKSNLPKSQNNINDTGQYTFNVNNTSNICHSTTNNITEESLRQLSINNTQQMSNIEKTLIPENILSASTDEQNTPDYKIEANRRISFVNNWSVSYPVNVEDLVRAGFYYIGPADRVRCAWCAGGLYQWEDDDIPICEHIKYYPQCSYVKNKTQGLYKQEESLTVNIETTTTGQNNIVPEDNVTKYNLPPMDIGHTSENGTSTKDRENIMASDLTWINDPAIKIIIDMGYNKTLVAKARQQILLSNGELTTDNLLDVLFDMDTENMGNDENQEGPSRNSSLSEGTHDDRLLINGHDNTSTLGNVCEKIPPVNSRQYESPHCNTMENTLLSNGWEHVQNLQHSEATSLSGNQEQKVEGTALNLDEISQLREETLNLKNSTTCKSCRGREVNILFLPCAHLIYCEECSSGAELCPLCRATITSQVKIYMS